MHFYCGPKTGKHKTYNKIQANLVEVLSIEEQEEKLLVQIVECANSTGLHRETKEQIIKTLNPDLNRDLENNSHS